MAKMSPACASLLSATRPLLERCCVAALPFFMHEAVVQRNVEDSQVRVLWGTCSVAQRSHIWVLFYESQQFLSSERLQLL